ncbi:hypothetical protein BZA77DRAFT_67691 [Pyronema omphalodes]|nr:hypothetical protein BZA77DRAFT_67691 [Pyronema omphalodes]
MEEKERSCMGSPVIPGRYSRDIREGKAFTFFQGNQGVLRVFFFFFCLLVGIFCNWFAIFVEFCFFCLGSFNYYIRMFAFGFWLLAFCDLWVFCFFFFFFACHCEIFRYIM